MGKKQKNSSGFTLIELMIVVSILGVLAAIAGPMFAKQQAKSKQIEAKLGLAAIYMSEKSFYEEYSAYIGSLDAIGFAPEGTKRFYNIGWNAAAVAPLGYNGTTSTPNYAELNNTGICNTGTILTGNINSSSALSFTVQAIGCIRNNSTPDLWSINDVKQLQNLSVGL